MGTAATPARSYFGRLADRYRDAYSVAAGITRYGNLVKLCSLVLGGIIVVGAFYQGMTHYEYVGWEISWFTLIGGVFLAAVVAGVGYMSGIFLAAQGQFMSAMLDTAVNTSPHLQSPEKATIMSL